MPDKSIESLDIGAHLTIAGGIPAAMKMAHEIGATNFQFFPRNPRGGARRAISQSEMADGRAARVEYGIRTVICHLPYTVNPASPDERISDFARMVVAEDVPFAAEMGADFVVLHPGAHMGDGPAAGIERVGRLFDNALAGYRGGARVLFEVMAGGGSVLGSTVSDIAGLIQAAGGHEWLGTCFDSCHLLAAGWDVTTPAGIDTMLAAFDAAVGLSRVGCMHLNDSKTHKDSHKDRHELIGRGVIGESGLLALLSNPFIRALPLCLETPVDDIRDYDSEIRQVRRIAALATV
ncbi:MAG TPA: deoxyribonuclease IV [Myxococcota bacterium]|nr:deoxyribonuclease IV [Myxococcota bacterium]HOA12727.1 deoxyribonuclease IV [Myxococcota bacterium]HOD00516.1 deoxyribonuclease IV [Myxococcota bacterium]HOH76107.1 deoxyribonuclease IV [Myxococcota bacterium]HPV03659.1 deoxyribonuclease IV [Myxococcota bacterium]